MGRFLPATRRPPGDALLPVRPSPRALRSPEHCTYRPWAQGSVRSQGSGAWRWSGGSGGPPPARPPAALLTSHLEGLGEGGALAGALGPSCRPCLCPPRPARFPAPTLPSAPPLFPGSLSPSAAGWAPQKPCAAASLFGTWPFFNSRHTERIQLELGQLCGCLGDSC